jgi:hypothetical protein
MWCACGLKADIISATNFPDRVLAQAARSGCGTLFF